MKKKIREWISVYIVKSPAKAILLMILLLNVLLLFVSGLIISALAPESLKYSGFWPSVFYTVSMILDAGCIQFIIEDIGEASVALVLICLAIILVGMVTFTGAVIGYVTNYISGFIENSQSGTRALKVSGHTVILNWNSRASEIINDLLYTGEKEIVVVLVPEEPDKVENEINERLAVTLRSENGKVTEACKEMDFWHSLRYKRKNMLRNNITLIVKKGDTYSTKQLNDISILQAKTVIILGRDVKNKLCKYELMEYNEKYEKGNSNTIKTLVQVAELTGSDESCDDQVVIVEVDDDWTGKIVERIIAHKEHLGKCNIVPVPVNRILGQLLSQFSVMPELNFVYSDLFSNKGAEFLCREVSEENASFVPNYLKEHMNAIPLRTMKTKTGVNAFYVADKESEYDETCPFVPIGYTVKPKENFWLEQRNVIIIGHNSNSQEIMDGFNAFRGEWNIESESEHFEIMNVMIIDDKKGLEKRNYYEDKVQYPYVKEVVEADVYDDDKVKEAIYKFIHQNELDVSILILSDDAVPTEDIDANVLTYLIYVQDVILQCKEENPDFDRESVDVIVEIVNPKNHEVARSYSVDNVVISNRYVSKMITQISRKEALYEFYKDILTYDAAGVESFVSEEMYIKKVKRFFDEIPAPCTAAELIRAVYNATPADNKAIVVGYVSPGGKMVIFSGDQENIRVELTDKDKLIIFSNH